VSSGSENLNRLDKCNTGFLPRREKKWLGLFEQIYPDG
jgi:hypothetical protein